MVSSGAALRSRRSINRLKGRGERVVSRQGRPLRAPNTPHQGGLRPHPARSSAAQFTLESLYWSLALTGHGLANPAWMSNKLFLLRKTGGRDRD